MTNDGKTVTFLDQNSGIFNTEKDITEEHEIDHIIDDRGYSIIASDHGAEGVTINCGDDMHSFYLANKPEGYGVSSPLFSGDKRKRATLSPDEFRAVLEGAIISSRGDGAVMTLHDIDQKVEGSKDNRTTITFDEAPMDQFCESPPISEAMKRAKDIKQR